MKRPEVGLEIDARGVATVTLNRPEVNNAYNGDMIAGLIEAVGHCGENPDVRVVVLRGAGRHFQAGADLAWLRGVGRESPEENLAVSRRTASAVRGLNDLDRPTVALVHGGCFGGGTGIVAACDIVVASEDAIFSITETRWGVMAGIIIPYLNVAMGARQVRRYALTCERFGAGRAHELGLVHELCPTGGLDAAAAPIIDALLMAAPVATVQTKQVTLEDAGLLLADDRFEALVAQHSAKRQSAEAIEGLASFAEKRKPAWYPGDGDG